jgi:hypothetical protein
LQSSFPETARELFIHAILSSMRAPKGFNLFTTIILLTPLYTMFFSSHMAPRAGLMACHNGVTPTTPARRMAPVTMQGTRLSLRSSSTHIACTHDTMSFPLYTTEVAFCSNIYVTSGFPPIKTDFDGSSKISANYARRYTAV